MTLETIPFDAADMLDTPEAQARSASPTRSTDGDPGLYRSCSRHRRPRPRHDGGRQGSRRDSRGALQGAQREWRPAPVDPAGRVEIARDQAHRRGIRPPFRFRLEKPGLLGQSTARLQGCSSVGRVPVSKTGCRRFEPCRPCQPRDAASAPDLRSQTRRMTQNIYDDATCFAGYSRLAGVRIHGLDGARRRPCLESVRQKMLG